MAKIILLEGAEGSGKSTLAVNLQRAWPGPSYCIHFSKRESTDYTLMKHLLAPAYILSNNYLIILDRTWLSDQVYRYLDKEVSAWTWPTIKSIETSAIGLGAKLVLLTGSFYKLNKRSKVGHSIGTEVSTYLTQASQYWERYTSVPAAEDLVKELTDA